MFRHVFKIIWNNRLHNFWLIGGLFVISISLWYAVDYLYSVGVNQNRSLGFDWHHVYKIQIGALTPESPKFMTDPEHTEKAGNDLLTFMNRLEHHPAVESVCLTNMHKHYEWTNRSSNLYVDTLSVNVWFRTVTPDYFRVFRVHGADGSSPEALAGKAILTDLIITKQAEKRLFPNGEAVGKKVFDFYSQDTVRISAVTENQKYNEYTSYYSAVYEILSMNDIAALNYQDIPWHGLYIRVLPQSDGDDFIRTFRHDMRAQLMIGNLYLKDMRPMSAIRDEHLKDDRNEVYTYLTVIVFFLLNAFLAVLGTFWSRTQQRRSELALRLAIGSSKWNVSRILNYEGVCLLTIAYLLAMIVNWNLGIAELVPVWPIEFTFTRFIITSCIGYFLLLLIVRIGIWYPSRQAMKIKPAEALHEE